MFGLLVYVLGICWNFLRCGGEIRHVGYQVFGGSKTKRSRKLPTVLVLEFQHFNSVVIS